nr:MAG TPA: hypothetical protein [Caudoviricetes sp.]
MLFYFARIQSYAYPRNSYIHILYSQKFSELTLSTFYLDILYIYRLFLTQYHFLSEYNIYLSKHNISCDE